MITFQEYLQLLEEELKIKRGEVNTSPTPSQIKSGKYKKAKANLHGLTIKIENPKGSTRSGVDPDGNKWSNTFTHHYGYIDNTISTDGDGLDVFIGNNIESEKVFVINQTDMITGEFDEVKIMLGFLNKKKALQAYKLNYESGWDNFMPPIETDITGLKDWIKNGDTTKEFDITAKNS